jgi:restriction system protein
MTIPDYQTLMLPVLRFYSDERERSIRDTIDAMSVEFKLTEQEKNEVLPSGQQTILENRVAWARTYLKKASLIESTRRGYNKITSRGIGVLKQNLQRIDISYLEQYDEFKTFRALRHTKEETGIEPESNHQTPEEALEAAYQKIRNDLAAELLGRLKSCSPNFFERLVVEVIVKMGYGGTRQDAGKAIGKSGDGGIDGIIKEDKLGLDTIYIQAKRWGNTVGRPEIHSSGH